MWLNSVNPKGCINSKGIPSQAEVSCQSHLSFVICEEQGAKDTGARTKNYSEGVETSKPPPKG
ncbi:hypothetical protein NUACC21_64750 [Scytonema sp. NUACC21]